MAHGVWLHSDQPSKVNEPWS